MISPGCLEGGSGSEGKGHEYFGCRTVCGGQAEGGAGAIWLIIPGDVEIERYPILTKNI